MKCHEVDYEIIGNDLQLVEIELDQNETIIAEAGAMTYMEEGIVFEAKMGDGSNPSSGFMGKFNGCRKTNDFWRIPFYDPLHQHHSRKETCGVWCALPR